MRTTRAVVAVIWLGTGCSPIFSGLNPLPSNLTNDLAHMAESMRSAQQRAEQHCRPYQDLEPSFAEEHFVGRELAIARSTASGHLVVEPGPRSDVSAWVAVVGTTLARASARPDLPWVFGIIESETPQSFSTPGGYVFVTTGLLSKLTNEAQLAGVLGHEIGHVVDKDALRAWRQTKRTTCEISVSSSLALNAGATAVTANQYASEFPPDGRLDLERASPNLRRDLINNTQQRVEFGFELKDEFAADAVAAHLLAFTGYALSEYETAVLALGPVKNHPTPGERAAQLKTLREGELAPFVHGAAKPDISSQLSALKK